METYNIIFPKEIKNRAKSQTPKQQQAMQFIAIVTFSFLVRQGQLVLKDKQWKTLL